MKSPGSAVLTDCSKLGPRLGGAPQYHNQPWQMSHALKVLTRLVYCTNDAPLINPLAPIAFELHPVYVV